MANTKVTTGVIKDDAVGADQLAPNAVVTASMVDNAVTTAKIANDAILTAKISDNAVNNAKLSSNSVDSDQYVDGSIDTAHIADSQITSAKLDTNIAVDGTLTVGSHLIMGDDDILKMGTDADLKIYHTATNNHSIIEETGGGNLVVRTNGSHIEFDKGSTEFMTRMIVDGAVELYYAGAKKLETATGGVTVTGTLTATTLAGTLSTAAQTNITSLGTLTALTGGTGDLNWDSGTLFVDSSANAVGIGNTLASSMFSGASQLVVGSGTGDQGITIYAGNSSVSRLHFADGTSGNNQYAGFIAYAHNDDKFLIGTGANGGTDVTIDGGKLGIGNSNPSGMSSNANKLVVGTGSGNQGMSVFAGTSVGRYAFARAVGDNTDAYDGGMAYDGSRNLTFHTNANATRMTIDGGGNVGIGTDNPSAKLHVEGAGDSQILIYETGTSPYTATLKLASQSTTAYGANVQYTSGAEQLTIENFGRTISSTDAHGSIRFRTKVGNSSMQEVLHINGYTGNVGIGTTSVANILQIAGALGLDHAAMSSAGTTGDFSITVGGLPTLASNAWKDNGMLVFYTGVDGSQAGANMFFSMIRIRGLSTYASAVVSNIVGGATISDSSASSTGLTINFDVGNNNSGSVFVLLLGGSADRPTISISG